MLGREAGAFMGVEQFLVGLTQDVAAQQMELSKDDWQKREETDKFHSFDVHHSNEAFNKVLLKSSPSSRT